MTQSNRQGRSLTQVQAERWAPARTYSYRRSPTRPLPGGMGGGLQKEVVWHIEAVGVVSSWS